VFIVSEAAATTAFTAAEAAYARGDLKTAIQSYLTAFAHEPESPVYRRTALESLNKLDGYKKLSSKIVAGLEDCVDDPTLDLQPLARVVKNIVFTDARFASIAKALSLGHAAFNTTLETEDHSWFFENCLLLATLTRATIIDEGTERTLTQIRRAAILCPALLKRYRAFVEALACHCVRTRHIWLEDSAEANERASAQFTHEKDRVLIHCLYEPLSALSPQDQELLPPLLKAMIDARREERQLAEALPRLTPISPGLSAAMRDQYETFPYPLWEQFGGGAPTTWANFVARFAQPPHDPVPQPAQLEILVAGCGTGRMTTELARHLPEANIIATDLSRTSLGYAVRKARDGGLRNITFGIGDILMLGTLNRHFHFIECGGVLHHMADPAAGLRVLVDLLEPGGLMCIALYSERAREPIVAARKFVAAEQFPDTIEGMRAMRAAIFALPEDNTLRRISRRMDFYWADGLHDLVFNVHEIRFTPLTLKTLIEGAGLAFLGFEVSNPAKRAAYHAQFPHDPLGRDLTAWDEFEKIHSDTFMGMFQMWLQKPV